MKTTFFRLIEAEEKGAILLEGIQNPARFPGLRVEVEVETFKKVPRSPFAYWASPSLRERFSELPPFESDGRLARQGLCTMNDFRWLRLCWESSPTDRGETALVPFAKGGYYSPYYADIWLAVRWGKSGRWLKEWKIDQLRQEKITANNSKCWNESRYFHPGLTWPRRTSSGLSLRVMPADSIFADKGPTAFVAGDDHRSLLALLAIANSRPFAMLTELQLAAADAAARSYEVGIIQRTPVPVLTLSEETALANLARRAWSLKRTLDTRFEVSHAFFLPALLQVVGKSLDARITAWIGRVQHLEEMLGIVQSEIDAQAFKIYSLDDGECGTTSRSFEGVAGSDSEDPTEGEGIEQEDASDNTRPVALVAELLSWSVGVAFGRFDVRHPDGSLPPPPEPEPFDPLQVCSSGMLISENRFPYSAPPLGYPLSFPTTGVLIDDPGHPEDLAAATHRVFEVIFAELVDDIWQEAAAHLDPKGRDLRSWLAQEFFELHIKRYSRSRRKAPIYWQLATPSASYSVWVYSHRVTSDTFYQILNDLILPKLAHEAARLSTIVQAAGPDPGSSQRRDIQAQESLVAELRSFKEEVARVAPLWRPDLDDGMVLTMAPLWRLVPQLKGWQKELKSHWDDLAAGDYDWAHIAMHLWPERVVPKCATDRSLAIAHGLEETFWVEDSNGKWHPLEVTAGTVQELVTKRTSPAVKAALAELLAASAPGGGRSSKTPSRPPRAVKAAPSSQASRDDGKSRGQRLATPAAGMDESVLTSVTQAIAQINGGASKEDVLRSSQISETDWSRAIATLLERGAITKTGERRGTRYHVGRGPGGSDA